MEYNITQINNKIKRLCNIFNIDFFQVENWLQQNRLEQYQETEKFFNAININIYGKFIENCLNDFEFRAWVNVLDQWRESWVQMLTAFWQANKQKKVA